MISIASIKIDTKTKEKVAKILASGKLIEGKVNSDFEKSLKSLNNTKYATTFNSGTSALHSALEALRLPRGSQVITSPLSFIATGNAILMASLEPVFVDIDEHTFNINPLLIEKSITKITKAILTVDLYGRPCDYDRIKKIAKSNKLFLISDSCQAIGTKYKQKPISHYTDATVFSFYATKNVTSGEGGAIVTNNPQFARFVNSFKNQGRKLTGSEEYEMLGYNYRLLETSAALGLAQLEKLGTIVKMRQKHAKLLSQLLKNKRGIILPEIANSQSNYHQYTIRVSKGYKKTRDQLLLDLNKNGVGARIYYRKIIPKHKHFNPSKAMLSRLKVADKITSEIISLPIHEHLMDADIKKIASII